MRRCYEVSKLPHPKAIIWVDSPLVLALAAPMSAYFIELHRRLSGATVGDTVRATVRATVGDTVGEESELVRLTKQALKSVIRDSWYKYFGGQFWVSDYYWWGSPSMVSFFREVCGLEMPEDIAKAAQAYQETSESACWWFPTKDFVMVCERPAQINRDELGRLHSIDGAAISWPDGWAIHCVGGVRVPSDIIENRESITVARIDAEQNAEVRRVMLELYGLERFLSDSGALKISEDSIGTLYSRTIAGAEYRFARVINSTAEPDGSRKVYVLGVVPTAQTCHEAIAASFGLSVEEYNPVWQS